MEFRLLRELALQNGYKIKLKCIDEGYTEDGGEREKEMNRNQIRFCRSSHSNQCTGNAYLWNLIGLELN